MNKNKLIAVAMICIIVLNLAGCQSKKSLKNSSDIEKEFCQPRENSSVIETVEFDKEIFLKYFEDFPQFFHNTVTKTSDLIKSPPTFFFLLYMTYNLETQKGTIFEMDNNYFYLIPEEKIKETSVNLLGITFDFNCINSHKSAVNSKVPNSDLYRYSNEIDINVGTVDINENSICVNEQQIEIVVNFTYYSTESKTIVTKTLQYIFNIVQNGTTYYQLFSIIEK